MAGRGSIIGDELRRLAAAARLSESTGIPSDEILEARLDRRQFLKRAARVGAAGAVLPSLSALAAACSPKDTAPPAKPVSKPGTQSARIAIVGAGLAGMTAAYRLTNAGHPVTVYEVADYIGGRTLTLHDYFDGGVTVEQGGNWINSDHKAIIQLVKELGLELTNLNALYPPGLTGLYWFDGKRYDRQVVYDDFLRIYPTLKRDLHAAGYPTTYNHKTEAGVHFDNMSITEWIEKNVPGGTKSRFGQLLQVGYTGEYGLDPDVQPALNLLYEIGYSPANHVEIYGPQDYKYRVKGGNQLVSTTIGDRLPGGTVRLGHQLVALKQNANGSFTMAFQQDAQAPKDVTADHVILTLPFTVLRNTGLSQAGFDALKMKAINELGMGTNAKMAMQFNERVWEQRGWTGDLVTNMPMEESDIVYPAQSGPGGILVNYLGGSAGTAFEVSPANAHAPAPTASVDKVLSQLDSVQKGFTDAYNGKSWLAAWPDYPWTQGSYSCPTLGQTSSIWGVARIPSGRCFFAGEHTQIGDYGFMTGAVGSGNRAAAEVLASLGEK